MDKLRMESADIIDEKVKKIAELFPDVITEAVSSGGGYRHLIDFDALKQELSDVIVEGNVERYQFSWPDKRKSVLLVNQRTTNTLRLDASKSVGRDGTKGSIDTENLYIEGDNIEVLKLLRETYLGKIKVIYIDPPYNTGSDAFVYDDDRTVSEDEFVERFGQKDDEGNLLFDMRQNNETNGRFHTDWLNMIYPRIRLSRELLSDDGVIFISIDDHEQENLKKICDEVFGNRNFIAQIVWERAYAPVNLMKQFSPSHDYVLCYSKNIDLTVCNGVERNKEEDERYSNPDDDPRGLWRPDNLSVGPAVPENIYPITTPSGRVVLPPSGRSWLISQKSFEERVKDNRIWFGANGNNVPSMKRFRSELRKDGVTPMTIWKYSEVDHSQGATKKLIKLFDGKKYFDYPKPVDLIKRCIRLYSDEDSYVMDFFSGSATTAHAVMQLNAEDGGKRKFILVQLPEPCDEKSDAYKDGYKNICDIGEDRIVRAGKQIKEDSPLTTMNLDVGFRVLKLDSSNMKDVYYNPDQTSQQSIEDMLSNVKEDRTPMDLLFQVMLETDVLLSSKIDERTIEGKKVFVVNDNDIICCFDDDIGDDVVKSIAQMKPLYAVFRDSSFKSDDTMVNAEQYFRTYAPDTQYRII